jgi:hypothetical protein
MPVPRIGPDPGGKATFLRFGATQIRSRSATPFANAYPIGNAYPHSRMQKRISDGFAEHPPGYNTPIANGGCHKTERPGWSMGMALVSSNGRDNALDS